MEASKRVFTFRNFLKVALFLGTAWLFFLSQASADAAFTPTINYQGKLTDSSGLAVPDGAYNMRFWLLSSPSIATTSALWSETHTGSDKVTVQNGLFSLMLGSTTALSGVDFNQTLYLGVEIGGTGAASWDGEMSPRKILGAVPAAFEASHAADADTFSGVASTSFLRSDQADTASGLLTFTGGIISNSSSTITSLTAITATTTNFVINGERFTDLTGTGLQNSSGVLTVNTTYLDSRYASSTQFDTCAELAAIMTGETGTCGSLVLSASPTFTGTVSAAALTLSSTLTLSGSAANIALGSNYLSGDGGDEGVFVDSAGKVGINTDPGATYMFNVNGDEGSSHTYANIAGAGGGQLDFGGNEYNSIRFTNQALSFWTAQNNGFRFYTDSDVDTSTPELTIAQNGKVGIGTSTPQAKLSIAQSATLGSELVTNGTFTGSATGWTLQSGCSDYSSGTVVVLYDAGCSSGAGLASVSTDISITSGTTYLITFDITANGDEMYFYLENVNTEYVYGPFGTGSHGVTFVSDYTGTETINFESWNYVTDAGFTIDNVSIKAISDNAPAFATYDVTGATTTLLGLLSGNVAIGKYALTESQGVGVAAIGYGAGYNATDASYANFFGSTAGYNATGATGSNFFGQSAGYNATAASDSNFLGTRAGLDATNAPNSNFFGAFSGYGATNASFSNFLGRSAGQGATDASHSNFFGNNAGVNATNAKYSNFFNDQAGFLATNASFSNFLGRSAGQGATNAATSTFIGYQAGYSADNASNALFLGSNAGYNDTVNNTGNVASTSIAIGNYSGTGGFSNSIALGQGVKNTAAKQLNIGNVLYATGIYSSNTTSGTALTGGRLGIATSTPAQTLTVAGSARITGALYGSNNSAGTNGMVLKSTGTGFQWVATSTLGITGSSFSNSSQLAALLSDETGTNRAVFSNAPAFSGTATFSALTATSTLTLSGTTANIALGSNYLSGDGGDEGVFVASDGKVGIGTSTPNQALSIFRNGADAAIEFSRASGSTKKWTLGVDDSDGGKFKISSSSALGTNDRFVITGAGLVGIGTNTPGDKFHVAAGNMLLDSGYVLQWGDFKNKIWGHDTDGLVFQTENVTRMIINESGNVGINTDPGATYMFNVNGDEAGTDTMVNLGGSGGTYLDFGGNSYNSIRFANQELSFWTAQNKGFRFYADSDVDTTIPEFTIAQNGRVGVGTSTPSGKLHVYSGTSGAAVNSAADDLVIEGSGNAGFSILTPDASNANIYFATPADGVGAQIQWNYTSDLFTIGAHNTGADVAIQAGNGTDVMRLLDSGNVGIGTSTPGYELVLDSTDPYTAMKIFSDDTTQYSNAMLDFNHSGVAAENQRVSLFLEKQAAGAGGTGWFAMRHQNYSGTSDHDFLGYYMDGASSALYLDSLGELGVTAGTGDIKFNTNGSQRMIITAAGNIGIGTSTPNQALTIFRNGADAAIEFSRASGSSKKWTIGVDDSDGGKFKISSSSALGTNDRFVIDGAGRVGIGTSTPANNGDGFGSKFSIVGDNDLRLLSLLKPNMTAGSNAYMIFGRNPSTNNGSVFHYRYEGSGSTANYLGFGFFDNDDVMTVGASGYVGIGSSSPSALLTVVHPDGTGSTFDTVFFGYDSTGNGNGIRLRVKDTALGVTVSDIAAETNLAANGGNTNLTFSTRTGVGGSLTERMRINQSGNVGIGTSTPNQALTIFRNAADAAIELSSASGANSKWTFGLDYSDGGKFKISSSSALGTNDRFVINGSGYVGIGTSTPKRKLHILGSDGAVSTFPSGLGSKDFLIVENNGNAHMGLIGSTAGSAEYKFYKSGGTDKEGSVGYDFSSNYLQFSTGGANIRMVINSSGYVGIGTTTPNTRATIVSDTASNVTFGNSLSGGSRWTLYVGDNSSTLSAGSIGFGPGPGLSGSSKFVIDSSGNVGIGTISPTQKLTVSGSILLKSQAEAASSWGTGYNGSQESITAMTEFNGYLYAGQGNGTGDGDVLICDPSGGGNTSDCDNAADWSTSYDGSQEVIWGFAEYKGKLYASQGSTLSSPTAGDGDIFVCNPATTGNALKCDSGDWSTAYDSAAYEMIFAMAEFNGKLYAAPGISTGDGDILVCNPDAAGTAGICDNASDWSVAYNGAQEGFAALASFQGRLYAGQGTGAGDGDVLVSSDGTTWATSFNGSQEYIRALTVYNDKLYLGQNQDAGDNDVYMTSDGVTWSMSYNGAQEWLNALTVYNGSIYAAQGNTTGDGDVFTMTGSSTWSTSYNGSQEEITSFAVYNGKLYAGQGNSTGDGDVLYMNQAATTSYPLKFAAGNSTGDIWFSEESLWGAAGPNGEVGVFKMSHALVTTAGSFDVAEDYPTADKSLEPGDIVAYDTRYDGYLKKAAKEDRALLAGVVSGQPGFLLSSKNREGSVPTALVGRVPVKATAENGAIAIGDSITISDTEEGTGMKANFGDKAIGYALEPLSEERDSGTILIYVSPHYAFGMNPDPALLASEGSASSTSALDGSTILDRMVELANGFVDGVLSTIGVKTTTVNTANLCVGVVCVDEATFLKMVESSGASPTEQPPVPTEPDPQEGGGGDEGAASSTDPLPDGGGDVNASSTDPVATDEDASSTPETDPAPTSEAEGGEPSPSEPTPEATSTEITP
jgi:hypothetical protein